MEAIGKAQDAYQDALERFRRGLSMDLDADEHEALTQDLDKARVALEVAWLDHHAGASPERVAQIEREHAEQARERTRILSAPAWAPENTDPPSSKGGLVQKVLTAFKLLLADAAQLQVPGIASSVAGVVAAILGLLGYDFPLGVILAWVTTVGTVAGVVEKVVTGKATPSPAPAPVPVTPPTPPAPPANPAGPTPRAK